MKTRSPDETLAKAFNYKILSTGLISSVIVIGLSAFAAVFMLAMKFPRLTTDGAMAFARGFSLATFIFTLLFWIEASILKPWKLQKICFLLFFIGLISVGYWIFPAPFAVVPFMGATAFYCVLISIAMLAINIPLRLVSRRSSARAKSIFVYKLLQFISIWVMLLLQMALW